MSKPNLWSDSQGGGHEWITSRPPAEDRPPAPVEAERPERGALWSRIEVQLLAACAGGALVGVLTQVLR